MNVVFISTSFLSLDGYHKELAMCLDKCHYCWFVCPDEDLVSGAEYYRKQCRYRLQQAHLTPSPEYGKIK